MVETQTLDWRAVSSPPKAAASCLPPGVGGARTRMPSCTVCGKCWPVLGAQLWGSLASSPAQAALIQVGFLFSLLRTVLSTEGWAGPAVALATLRCSLHSLGEASLSRQALATCPVGSVFRPGLNLQLVPQVQVESASAPGSTSSALPTQAVHPGEGHLWVCQDAASTSASPLL